MRCSRSASVQKVSIKEVKHNPQSLPKHIYKPDIVFFGEKYPEMFTNYVDDDV